MLCAVPERWDCLLLWRAAHCAAQVHGKYSVLTNGRVLAEGRQSLLFTKPEGGAISLELLGRKAVIRIMANKMLLKFHYSCVVDGSAAPEPLAVGCMPCRPVPSRPVPCERRVAGTLAALGDFRLQHAAKAGGACMARWKSLLGPRYPLCVALTHSGCTRSRYHVAEEQSKRQSTIVSEACIPPVARYAARHAIALPARTRPRACTCGVAAGWGLPESLGCNAVHMWKRRGHDCSALRQW